jgi:diguanylate cyclase (GGDEF)-like protein
MKAKHDRQTILIVDDSVEIIDVLDETLSPDYEILICLTGAEALELLQRDDAVDLILLDVLMPEMDGYEVCRRLKSGEKTKDIPVLFVTALDDVEDEVRGLRIGAIDYITKPISPPIVRARVRNHLEYKRQRDLLEDLAAIDGLTGIANRRRFEETLESEWKRSGRSGTPLALLMIDIDYFKNFNDNYGHGAGDECLKKIAEAIAASTHREGDLAARYGGEEFAVLLAETDQSGAMSVSERIQSSIADLNIPHAFSLCSDRVTVSIGAGSMVPEARSGPNPLVIGVDELLYRAKRSGRDRMEIGEL